jgi:hypothetical protein
MKEIILTKNQLIIAYLIMVVNCFLIGFIFEFFKNEIVIILAEKSIVTFHFLQFVIFFFIIIWLLKKVKINPFYHLIFSFGLILTFPIINFLAMYIGGYIPNMIPRNYIGIGANSVFQGDEIDFLNIPKTSYVLEEKSPYLNSAIQDFKERETSGGNWELSLRKFIFYHTAILNGYNPDFILEVEKGLISKTEIALKAPFLSLIETFINSFRVSLLLLFLNFIYCLIVRFKGVYWTSTSNELKRVQNVDYDMFSQSSDMSPLTIKGMEWFISLK